MDESHNNNSKKMTSFRQWLENNKGLKDRSARDVVSRVKRVEKMTDMDLDSPVNKVVDALVNNEEYLTCSEFVRPQIKRSIKLYEEFLSRKG